VTGIPITWWEGAAVPRFRTVSARYIEVIRDRETYSASELLHRVHLLLPELYALGLALPVKPESAYDEEESVAPETEVSKAAAVAQHTARWNSLYIALGKQIGSRWNAYQEVFDPYAEPPEAPVTGSLADDLTDIFLDLEDGEELWCRGNFDEAVWEWRFGFESHWGEHVSGALRAIRTLAAVHDLGFPDPSA
jgi:hypothetical protein